MAEPAQHGDRRIWRARAGLNTAIAFTLLVLLPFYVSVGPMLLQRLRRGLWTDTAGLLVLGTAFTIVMALLALRLLHAVRSRVEINDRSVSFTLPIADRTLPLLAFNSATIPFQDVRSVETRREVFGGRLAPTFVRATRLILRDGRAIVLGYVNEQNEDQTFPFPEIGAEIARRAGIEIADKGTVRRDVRKRVPGFTAAPDDNRPVPDAEITAMRRQHSTAMRALIAGLVLLVAGGIVVDAVLASRSTYAEIGGTATPARRPLSNR